MFKVVGLVTFFNLLTLVNLVKVVNLEGNSGKMKGMEGMEKIKQMEKLEMVPIEKKTQMEKILMEARHFPHSSVTREEIENGIATLVKMEARHFPHSSVTRHTSAHTRLPQKGVFGESIIIVVINITMIVVGITVMTITIKNRVMLVIKDAADQNHPQIQMPPKLWSPP